MPPCALYIQKMINRLSETGKWGCFLLLTGLALFSGAAGADVWIADQVWDATWEQRYADWLFQEVDEDFLKPTSLRPDCADLVYTLRAVFARDHRLPFLASAASGRRVGHYSQDWDGNPTHPEWRQDARFVAFLGDLYGVVSTRTLYLDTYPVALNAQTIRPGLMVYEDRIAAHAVVLGRVGDKTLLPITYYEAFRPGQNFVTVSPTTSVQLYGPEIPHRHSGVVHWRWPRIENGTWDYAPKETMPDYSLEQYDPAFSYRTRIGGLLNRLAYERLRGHAFIEGRFIAEILQPLIHAFEKRIRLDSHAWQKQDSPVMQIDGEILDQFNRIWSLLNGYAVPRARFEEQFGLYAFLLDKNRPPIPALLILDAFQAQRHSMVAQLPLEHRWGVAFNPRTREWNLLHPIRGE
ncbi:MAG: hypothetical protein HPY51_02980 [Candidatus Omnitrophica bacterium]|nr:hypothetical protein [Candidatus Omnitrophota bacterium]